MPEASFEHERKIQWSAPEVVAALLFIGMLRVLDTSHSSRLRLLSMLVEARVCPQIYNLTVTTGPTALSALKTLKTVSCVSMQVPPASYSPIPADTGSGLKGVVCTAHSTTSSVWAVGDGTYKGSVDMVRCAWTLLPLSSLYVRGVPVIVLVNREVCASTIH